MLQAQKRQILGRKVKALRKAGTLPASVYGKKVKSLPVQVQAVDFDKVFAATGETGIIQLKIEKEKETRPVLATNRQKDPVTDKIIHIDFHQVDLKEKVTVAIPIETAGESPAVKEKSAVLVMVLDEVKVEALPQDLPEGHRRQRRDADRDLALIPTNSLFCYNIYIIGACFGLIYRH